MAEFLFGFALGALFTLALCGRSWVQHRVAGAAALARHINAGKLARYLEDVDTWEND